MDARTDIYAVGAILYRALTGRAPFQGGDAAEVLSLVLTAEPPRPMSLDPSIPDALELLIQRAMAKSVGERYQSMDELDQALAAFGRPRKSRSADRSRARGPRHRRSAAHRRAAGEPGGDRKRGA